MNSTMDMHRIDVEHAARLSAIDPLIRLPESDNTTSTDLVLSVDVQGSAALGRESRIVTDPDSRPALTRALCEFRLDVRLGGAAPGEALGALLDRWHEHLLEEAAGGDWDTAAIVRLPSRDCAGSFELLRHGFAPMRVLAARPADRLAATGVAQTPGVHIRAAEPEDLTTALQLNLEFQRYEAQFGLVTLRPKAEQILRDELAELLSRDEPTVWIAELYGQPLGLLHVQLPPETQWVADIVQADRVGYLALLHIAEAARSSGVGTALATFAHHVFDAVDVALLHHTLANPRSTSFWYAQGYRPLWTYWYRRPAVR